jgi:hypothetical protein
VYWYRRTVKISYRPKLIKVKLPPHGLLSFYSAYISSERKMEPTGPSEEIKKRSRPMKLPLPRIRVILIDAYANSQISRAYGVCHKRKRRSTSCGAQYGGGWTFYHGRRKEHLASLSDGRVKKMHDTQEEQILRLGSNRSTLMWCIVSMRLEGRRRQESPKGEWVYGH